MTHEEARLLKFLAKYRGWHSISRIDRKAIRTMKRLESHGIIEVLRYGMKIDPQARLILPEFETQHERT